MITCPHCHSTSVRRSRRRLPEHVRAVVSRKRPFRCDSCNSRWWALPPLVWPDPAHARTDDFAPRQAPHVDVKDLDQ